MILPLSAAIVLAPVMILPLSAVILALTVILPLSSIVLPLVMIRSRPAVVLSLAIVLPLTAIILSLVMIGPRPAIVLPRLIFHDFRLRRGSFNRRRRFCMHRCRIRHLIRFYIRFRYCGLHGPRYPWCPRHLYRFHDIFLFFTHN
jgi:hypothetical protein